MSLDLIGSTEAARIAGISPSTFRDLAAKGDAVKSPVPTPAIQGTQGTASLWHRADIKAWAATRDRQRGTSPKPDA
jgi:hypothetical protein